MTDRYTDKLFDLHAPKLIFPISRLICDVERFRDDAMEEMARCGMGVCYTRGHDGKPLRRLDSQRRKTIIERWYDPHHAALTKMTTDILKQYGSCFIVDCHSFPAAPLPYETDQNPNRPDICIGTDSIHTPQILTDALIESFQDRGYSVAINRPFSGTMVPMRYYHTDPRVRSVMIEINRGLYMDHNCRKLPSFPCVKQDIHTVLRGLSEKI